MFPALHRIARNEGILMEFSWKQSAMLVRKPKFSFLALILLTLSIASVFFDRDDWARSSQSAREANGSARWFRLICFPWDRSIACNPSLSKDGEGSARRSPRLFTPRLLETHATAMDMCDGHMRVRHAPTAVYIASKRPPRRSLSGFPSREQLFLSLSSRVLAMGSRRGSSSDIYIYIYIYIYVWDTWKRDGKRTHRKYADEN
jgi:hypothetical protein